jgi:Protein of unknown function (DUF1580)
MSRILDELPGATPAGLLEESRGILHEQPLLTLTAAAKLFPSHREGKPTHFTTVLRYAQVGVRTRSGAVVYLEVERCGGSLVTSAAAVQRFIRAQRDEDLPDRQAYIPQRTPSKRQASSAAAAHKLAAAGYC